MLALKDPDDDLSCDYEPKTVKQKKKKPKALKRENLQTLMPKAEEFTKMQAPNSLTDEQFAKVSEFEPELTEDNNNNKTSLTVLDSSNRNEENSKAFIGSLGSWINDFFNNQNRRPHTSPSQIVPLKVNLPVSEDTEYFKSINELKEQFKKKLECETSVHITGGDKFLEFSFDALGNEKKGKKKSKFLPTFEESKALSTEINELSSIYPQTIPKKDMKTSSLTIFPKSGTHSSRKALDLMYNDTFDLSVLKTDKRNKKHNSKRSHVDDFEKYDIPTLTDLSKKLLSNVADQDKCSQLYKNAHLVPEPQHCGSRKTKSYQSNARCYTTNANVRRSNSNVYVSLNSKCKSSHFYSTKASDNPNKKKLREIPRKALSEFIRDSSTYIRPRTAKPATVPHGTLSKTDVKASSDELVKHLMKKIKMNHRPQPTKKKSTCLEIAPNNRNRFMQSATNSLVLSVLARKENDSLLPIKGIRSADLKYFKPEFIKATFPSREAHVRYPDTNTKLEFRRTKNLQKINADTYLSEEFNKAASENPVEYSVFKTIKRHNEDITKKDLKDYGEKLSKRQEVKNMLSKIDAKHVLHATKVREKDHKKKLARNFTESFRNSETRDGHSPRFQRQHELFKIKTAEQNVAENNEEVEKIEQEAASNATALSTHLAVTDTNLQVIPDATVEEKKSDFECEENKKNFAVANQMAEFSEDTDSATDCVNVEKRAVSCKPEKSRSEKFISHKDKFNKTKSMQYAKENDTKNLLSSFSNCGNNELQSSKDSMKSYEPVLCATDFRSLKISDTSVLNRRFSTSSLSRLNVWEYITMKQQIKNVSKYTTDCNKKSNEKPKGNDCNKKEKENDRKPCIKKNESKAKDCGFEKIKKPGPNC